MPTDIELDAADLYNLWAVQAGETESWERISDRKRQAFEKLVAYARDEMRTSRSDVCSCGNSTICLKCDEAVCQECHVDTDFSQLRCESCVETAISRAIEDELELCECDQLPLCIGESR